ncbi:MAG: response regulator [Elusimicrobia bacterium]|nr:response regulator [Elusimicrobiota bacterium]
MSNVLVIDDDREVAEALEVSLSGMGHTIHAVYDGKSAIRVLTKLLPDLVVLDLGLPGASGLSVCRALRQHAAGRRVPILVLTGRAESDEQIRLLRLGADDYVIKPYEPRELRARVNALLRRTAAAAA